MKKITIPLLALLVLFATFSTSYAKMRIAYVEGGDFIDYNLILQGTARGLENLKIIEHGDSPLPKNATNAELWAWLAQNAGGDQIEFVADAFYSADWDDAKQNENIEALKSRIENQKDIDLIFAFGTAAGISVTKNITNVNIMNFSTTDPILSGISKSAEDSGNDYIHAKIEPDRYLKQIALFQYIFGFKNMGICYEDTERGRGVIAYDQIARAAKLYGFELIEGKIPNLGGSVEDNVKALKECHADIAKEAEAIYLTLGIGIGLGNEQQYFTEILDPLVEHNIPSFSQGGPQNVALGALLSMAAIDYDDMGYFEANVIKQILEGKKPREINQIYEGRFDFALNLAMAKAIEWPISFEVLGALDQLYLKMN